MAGTPTSAMISDSSSRSHASSSEASKAASEISAVNACLLFESESRSREKKPVRSSSGSGAPFASPSRSDHVLAIGRAP